MKEGDPFRTEAYGITQNKEKGSEIGGDIPEDMKPLPWIEKISYASGVVPGTLYGVFMGNIQTFYMAWMYLRQEWILIAQIFYGLWNLINDPIFGHLQDRTRTKSGRYIPWIKWSAPLFTLAFVMVFYPMPQWRLHSENLFSIEQISLFFWYLFSQMLYDTFFTIVYIAHTALLPQMTMNESERVQISILSSFAGTAGLLISWIPVYFLTDPNAEKIAQLQFWVVVIAALALIPWILVVKFVRERKEYIPEEESGFIENLKYVFKNPSGRIYVIYDGLSVGISNFLMTGITFALTWIMGLNSEYYEINPSWNIEKVIPYFIAAFAGLIVGVIVQLQIPKKYDIKTAIHIGLISEAIGFTLAFIGSLPPADADPNIPTLPAFMPLIMVGLFLIAFGIISDIIYHNPMRAETIDYDEYLTGERRESVYAGVGCVFSKPMISVALAGVTGIITYFGLRPKKPEMTDIATSLYWYNGYPTAMMGVAIACFLVPAVLAAIGVVIWKFYPLDRKTLEEVRNYLEKLHAEKRKTRLVETD